MTSRKAIILKASVTTAVTLPITFFLPPYSIVLAFTGFGNLPGWLLFPYSTMAFCFIPLDPPNNPVPISMDYIQCVVYGIVLGCGWIRERFIKTFLWLAASHVAAVIAAALVWDHTGLVWPL